jgi:type IV secretion system protein VirB10
MKAVSAVPGERTVARVVGARSLAARMQRALAAALVLIVGVAVLVWYYVHLGDAANVRATAGAVGIRSAVASEMRLPALEPAPAPTVQPASGPPSADGEIRNVGDAPAAQGRAAPHADVRALTDHALPAEPGGEPRRYASAPVLARSAPAPKPNADALSAALHDSTAATEVPPGAERDRGRGTLGDALQPTIVRAAEASLVATRRWLLPKGSFLDCTLETAIDSTFAGLTTCLLATDVYGADGRVVLMERGTKLIGETRSEVRSGQARVAVLWDEARTPTGVILTLASPGTDAVGRAGVPGTVDRHTGERFGAAILLSLLDAGVADVAARRQGSGAIVYNAQDSHDVATEVLRSTIAIPPTIRVAPGARLAVTVVRDIDFRSVYRLTVHEEQ